MNKIFFNFNRKLVSLILIAVIIFSPLSTIINTASAAQSLVPNITTQPVAALTTVVNTEFSLSVVGTTTSASSTLSYQWKSCDNAGTSCTNITGNNTATSSIYKKTPTATGTEYFKVDVYQTEEGNEISLATTSILSVVTITPPPAVTLSGPASVNIGDTFNVPAITSNFVNSPSNNTSVTNGLNGIQWRISFDNTKVRLQDYDDDSDPVTPNIVDSLSAFNSDSNNPVDSTTLRNSVGTGNSGKANIAGTSAFKFLSCDESICSEVTSSSTINTITITYNDPNGASFRIANGTALKLFFKAVSSGNANIQFKDGVVVGGANFINATTDGNGTIPSLDGTSASNNYINVTTQVASANIPVTGVSVNPTSLTLTTGATSTITASITPNTATNQSITWTTSSSTIASVSNGVVTAVSAGTATITATTVDGSFTATTFVTVSNPAQANIPVTGVSVNPTSLTLTTGATSTITATITPNTATNQSITWTTSSSTIASVSNGVVTAVSAGTATITATTVDGSFTATTFVTVSNPAQANIPVTGVSVNPTSLTLTTGATSTITASITPNTATNQSITWTTSSSTIASVSNGVVTAVSAGTATITATTVDGSFTATTFVTVSNPAQANIPVTGVSVNPTSLTLTTGATSTIIATITPNTATNQSITWTTSSSTIASVSNGVVTAVSAGTATITATTVDGSFTATTFVTVSNPAPVVNYTHITSASQLQAINNNLTGNYILDNNLDLSSIPNFTPIGSSASPFYGTFNGGGYTISNLKISAGENTGLFGYTASSSRIENFIISNPNIIGGNNTASAIGYNEGIVNNIGIINGNISSESGYTGGVIGHSKGTTTNVYYIGNITGKGIGGVIGLLESSTLSNSFSRGNIITSSGYADNNKPSGGIVAALSSATINNSYSLSSLYGNRSFLAGMAGFVWDGNINNSYSDSSMTGGFYYNGAYSIGGITSRIGNNEGGRNVSVSNVYYNNANKGYEQANGAGLFININPANSAVPQSTLYSSTTLSLGNQFQLSGNNNYPAVLNSITGEKLGGTNQLVSVSAPVINIQSSTYNYIINATATIFNVSVSALPIITNYNWEVATTSSSGPFTTLSWDRYDYKPDISATGTKYYRLIATNPLGVSTSSVIIVNVSDLAPAYTPNIITQPSSRSIEINNSTTFSVSANVSAGSLSYQWASSTDNATFTNISGATSSSYTTPIQSATGTIYYRVVITNTEAGKPSSSITSQSATLTINPVAVINNTPINNVVSGGGGGGIISNYPLSNFVNNFNSQNNINPVDNKNNNTNSNSNIILNKVEGKNLALNLQKFLNNNGYELAKSGAGAKGKETNTLGIKTGIALKKFQQTNLKAIGIKKATGNLDSKTLNFINKVIKGEVKLKK